MAYISATKIRIKTNIIFDGGFEPWLISATKIIIKTNVKFDGGFETCLVPTTKIKTNIKFENLPNFGVLPEKFCLKTFHRRLT